MLALPNGDVIVGGLFPAAGGVPANNIARWDGVDWHPLGNGFPGPVRSLGLMPNGDLVASGDIVARWDGTSWTTLGTPGAGQFAQTLVVRPNGHIVVGGRIFSINGVTVSNLASWDGSTWSDVGGGVSGLGLGLVYSLAVRPNGDLIVGGSFSTVGSGAGAMTAVRIARWTGSSWATMGSGLSGPAYALLALPSGDVIVGGSFSVANGIAHYRVARWNGATGAWSGYGLGIGYLQPFEQVGAMALLANGDLVVGGLFSQAGSIPANNLARWDGSNWYGYGSGANNQVQGLATLSNGDLVAAGTFSAVNGIGANRTARYAACPATATSYGSGCTGSGGLNQLAVASLPVVGSVFQATATGMPAASLALAVTGLAPVSVPLPLIFAEGVAGCDALVTPDFLDVVIPVGGTVQTQVAVPGGPAALGFVFHHQVVPLDLSMPTLSITSTNALTLSAGT